MSKGTTTRNAILDEALELASEVGLEGLTIGTLARRVEMSKSGLYAHFESKEALQVQVLDAAAARFARDVVQPALQAPRGLPRLEEIFSRWVEWSSTTYRGGCPFIGAATEFDDQEGPVRDTLVRHLGDAMEFIRDAAALCVEEGHFREDLDLDQFVFTYWGNLLAFHNLARLMRRPDARERALRAFRTLLDSSVA